MATASKILFTPDEYLARERQADYKSEYYRGEIFAMAGASESHNLIAMNVGASLHQQLKSRPCRVYPGDLRLRIPRTDLFTYPDLMVVCGEPQFMNDRRDVVLNPVLIVEVLSPSTEAYDRGTKFEHYRTIDSLQEYVLISQDRIAIDSFMRMENGKWALQAMGPSEQVHSLQSIGCQLLRDDVYARVSFGPAGSSNPKA